MGHAYAASLEEIRKAAERIKPYVTHTPVILTPKIHLVTTLCHDKPS